MILDSLATAGLDHQILKEIKCEEWKWEKREKHIENGRWERELDLFFSLKGLTQRIDKWIFKFVTIKEVKMYFFSYLY